MSMLVNVSRFVNVQIKFEITYTGICGTSKPPSEWMAQRRRPALEPIHRSLL